MSSLTRFFTSILLLQLDCPLLLAQSPAIQIGYVPMRPTYHPNPGEYIGIIVPPGKPWPARPEDYPQFSQTTKPPQSQRTTIANRIKEDENQIVANTNNTNISLSENSTDLIKPIQGTINLTTSFDTEKVTEKSPISLNETLLSNGTEKINELTTGASIKEETTTKAAVHFSKDHSKLYTSKPLEQSTIADENDIILNKLNISLPATSANVSNLLPFEENGNLISNKTAPPSKEEEQLFNIKPTTTVESNMKEIGYTNTNNNANPKVDEEVNIASPFIRPPPFISGDCLESQEGQIATKFQNPLVQNKVTHPVYEVKPHYSGYSPFVHYYNSPRLYHYRQAWRPKINPFIPAYKPFFF